METYISILIATIGTIQFSINIGQIHTISCQYQRDLYIELLQQSRNITITQCLK